MEYCAPLHLCVVAIEKVTFRSSLTMTLNLVLDNNTWNLLSAPIKCIIKCTSCTATYLPSHISSKTKKSCHGRKGKDWFGLVWFGIMAYQPLEVIYCGIFSINRYSSLSCRAACTDIPDPLSPLLPIVQRLWQVFRATSRIFT